MPPKSRRSYRPRAGPKRRRYRRYRRNRGTPTVVNKGISPLSQRYLTKLKYNERVSTSVGVSGTLDYLWRLNSIQDPNRTGIGHQPYGHDTLETMYNRYRVYKVKYAITYPPNISGALQTAFVQPENGESSYTSTNQDLIVEYPRTVKKLLETDKPTVIRGTISLPKLVGATKREYMDDDRYQAQFGNNPTELTTLHTGVIAGNGASVLMDVMLIYYVECFDPKQLAQS